MYGDRYVGKHENETITLHTKLGCFNLLAIDDHPDMNTIVMYKNVTDKEKTPVVRIHSECFTGDVLLSEKCDCGNQLHDALRLIEETGCGVLVYLRQEGRGIGLFNKIKAYKLQENGADTIAANEMLDLPIDARDYKAAADILLDLGLDKINLITNNPLKIEGLTQNGIEVKDIISLKTEVGEHNKNYIYVKKDMMNHTYNIEGASA